MYAAARRLWQRRWQRWLDRRIPRVTEVTLDQRRIFIFLSREGGIAALVLVALFIAGINYANNLLLGLSFFLGSLFIVAIHHTYANLSGLRIRAVGVRPAFAGEQAAFVLRLDDARGRRHESLRLDWEGVRLLQDVVAAATDITMPLPARRRGWFRPGRLRLSSVYPVGFLRAWTWLDLDLVALVYPHPEASAVLPVGGGQAGEGEHQRRPGHDDFEGLKTFTPGDALSHVSWKHLARGQGLLTKTYASEVVGSDMLDWDALAGVPVETRLSRLAWWVLQLTQQQRAYGLRLPGLEIAVDKGPEQQARCLKALALFGRERQP